MKKTLLFVACIFAFVSLAQAQGNKISWGGQFAEDGYSDLLGETDEAIFALGSGVIYVFDSKTLSLTLKKKLDIPKIEGKKPSILDGKVFGGKCYLFLWIGSDTKGALYATTVDVNGTVASNPTKIFELKEVTVFRKFLFQLSDDKSHLLVSFIDIVNYSYETAMFSPVNTMVFDEEFKVVNTVIPKINFDNRDLFLIYKSVIVDNNGDVFFTYSKGTPSSLSSYEAYSFSTDGQVYHYTISPAKVLADAKGASYMSMNFFAINTEGDLCLGGYYSAKDESSTPSPFAYIGTFYIKIDNENHTIGTSVVSPFSKETKMQALDGVIDLPSERGYGFGFSTKKVIVKDDGGIIVVSESSEGDYLGTIVLTCFGKDGETEWARAIPKSQYAQTSGKSIYFSFSVIADGKFVSLYYNGASEVYFPRRTIHFSKIPKADIEDMKLTIATIGYDGKDYDKKVLANAVNEGVAIMPNATTEGKDGSVLQIGLYKKVKKLGRIKL